MLAAELRDLEREGLDLALVDRAHTVFHCTNIALRLRRTLRWDPKAERFIGDEEASAMLSRPMRAPWSIRH